MNRLNQQNEISDPFIRFKDQENVTGLGRTTAYSYIKQGLMPEPIKLGPRACGWKLSTLREWMTALERKTASEQGDV